MLLLLPLLLADTVCAHRPASTLQSVGLHNGAAWLDTEGHQIEAQYLLQRTNDSLLEHLYL